MNKFNFCDISYSKLLKDEFPESEWKIREGILHIHEHFRWNHSCEDELERASKGDYRVIPKDKEDWEPYTICEYLDGGGCFEGDPNKPMYTTTWDDYPALTTDMVLERLPITIQEKPYTLTIHKGKSAWNVNYPNKSDGLYFYDKSLPNALAKILIYLKDNKLLEENNGNF